jgi:folate-binding protein YgfZ
MDRTVLARVERDVVVVSGPDATTFLQSLLSQDIEPVAVGDSTHALLLEPRGKLVVDLRMVRVADTEWWCLSEAGFGAVLATGLQRFKIRVKVEIEDRSASLSAVAVRGPDAVRLATNAEAVGARVDWAGSAGVEVVDRADAVDALVDRLVAAGVAEISGDAYEALRVEAGVPRQGYDIDETTIAQEAYLERDAVSFTKGCFLGQELVCRIDTRGHVNRALRRLRSDQPLRRGASVMADGKDVGTVTTAAGSVALAMMRSQIEPGATVAAGDVAATVEAVVAPAAS